MTERSAVEVVGGVFADARDGYPRLARGFLDDPEAIVDRAGGDPQRYPDRIRIRGTR